MGYDLFISYSRRDNLQGRVTQLVRRVEADFKVFSGRQLEPFFDVLSIRGMEDWRNRILQGLRESRLLLACLSPAYVASEHCEWEFTEYLKHEVGRLCVGEGVAPIYFIEVPGWEDRGFEQHCATWVAELRRRQHFDLRPWVSAGEAALREATLQAQLQRLTRSIQERVLRGERAERGLGNIDAHNPHFIGRLPELRRLRELVALERIGVITVIHGLGGIGKTALAIEYAHAFAHEYGGGCWQLRCEGKRDLCAAVAELASPLRLEFTDAEKRKPVRQFERVLAQLRRLADAQPPHRCLLILDNVDQPELLEPSQTRHLPRADWLHWLVTSRLGEHELEGPRRDRSFLPVDEMPEADALALIEGYQPTGQFTSEADRQCAEHIVHLLGRFTLAVETVAVYLGQFVGDVTPAGLLARLQQGVAGGLEGLAAEATHGTLHGEMGVRATLLPTLERLTEPEMLALGYAALCPADHVALPWIRTLVAARFAEMGQDAEPGYPDPWKNLLRRLLSLRLLQPAALPRRSDRLALAKMHRLVQATAREADPSKSAGLVPSMEALIRECFRRLSQPAAWGGPDADWEVGALAAVARSWLSRPDGIGLEIAAAVSRALAGRNRSIEAKNLIELARPESEKMLGLTHPVTATCLKQQGELFREMRLFAEADGLIRRALLADEALFGERHWRVARDLNGLALLAHDQGRLNEAEQLYQKALWSVAGSAEDDADAKLQAAIVQHNLADLLRDQGRVQEALTTFRTALATLRIALGDTHPYVAVALNNMAVTHHNQGDFAEADRCYREALSVFDACIGPDDLRVATTLHHRALLLWETHTTAEAVRLLQRALKIMRNVDPLPGRDDVRARKIAEDYAAILVETGCPRERIETDELLTGIQIPLPARSRFDTWIRRKRRFLKLSFPFGRR